MATPNDNDSERAVPKPPSFIDVVLDAYDGGEGMSATGDDARAELAALRAKAASAVDEVCWFIERREEPRWLCGFDYDKTVWTNDPQLAIRFCREKDAHTFCDNAAGKGMFWAFGEPSINIFPTEHAFVGEHPEAKPCRNH